MKRLIHIVRTRCRDLHAIRTHGRALAALTRTTTRKDTP